MRLTYREKIVLSKFRAGIYESELLAMFIGMLLLPCCFFIERIRSEVHRLIRSKHNYHRLSRLFDHSVECMDILIVFICTLVSMTLVICGVKYLLTLFFSKEDIGLIWLVVFFGIPCIHSILKICFTLFYHPASNKGFISRQRIRVAKEMNLSLGNNGDCKRVDRKIVFQSLEGILYLMIGGVISYLIIFGLLYF